MQKRAGRWFLILQGIGLIIVALALLGDAEPRYLSDAFDNASLAPGALWISGIAVGAGFALAIWSVARPATSASVVAWSATLFALPAFVIPFVWRTPISASGTLASLRSAHGVQAVRSASVGTLALACGAMAFGFAAVAAARRARREAAPELGWRAITIGLAGTFAYAAVTTWVRAGVTDRAAFFLAVPGALSILALTAAATARRNPDSKEVWHAIVLSFGAMVLGWSSAWLSVTGRLDLTEAFRQDDTVEMAKHGVASARHALFVFGPWLLGFVLAMPTARDIWVLARLAGPVATGLLVAGTNVTVVRTAIARMQHVVEAWDWTELTEQGLVDDEECDEVPPSSIVWARGGSIRLPNGDAFKPPLDFGGIAANIDAIDSSADMWLGVDTQKWGDVGQLIDAVGRRRGPRGAGLSSDEPLEGCAVRFVGRWNGKIACSDPIGIAIDGCLPVGSPDERSWRAIVDGDDVEARWEQNGKTITTIRSKRAALRDFTRSEWNASGSHRDPYDIRFDHAVLELPARMSMTDALAIIGAVRATQRMVNRPASRSRPAFVLSLALR